MTETRPVQTLEAQLLEAYAIRGNNLPRSIELATSVLALASQQKDDVSFARASNLLSLFQAIQCNFDSALQYASQALAIALKNSDKKGIADAYYNLASVHYRKDNYNLGLDYLLKCLRLYSELGDLHNLTRVNKSMGTVYEYFGDYNSAEIAYQNCIEISKQIGDGNSESNAYNPLSGILLKKGLIDEAEQLIDRSMKIKQETKDHRGLGFALYGRGKVLLVKKQITEAIAVFKESLAIHSQYGDRLGLGMTYTKISEAYFEQDEVATAEEMILKALAIAEQTGIQFIRFRAYHRLYLIGKKLGDQSLAFHYLEKYIEAKEAVINSKTSNIIKGYSTLAEIENLEKEAIAQKEKAEIIARKNDELDSFFYRVSHDLKGPISSLIGLYNLAGMEIKDEAALQYIDMFNNQTQRINNIVLGLIDLINLRNETSKTLINFQKLVDECIQSCFYLEKFSSVRIIKEIDSNIEFYSEWAIVNTILQNLIENAIKYSRTAVASYVKVKISTANNKLLIEVEDNGEGIPDGLQTNMFNMFVRGNSRHNGSGLGLYILNRAVERLNGIICVDSAPQKGSKFTVSIPMENTF